MIKSYIAVRRLFEERVSLKVLGQLGRKEHEKGSLITQRSIRIKTVHHRIREQSDNKFDLVPRSLSQFHRVLTLSFMSPSLYQKFSREVTSWPASLV